MRAVWKGQLRLSLVSIPVELYPATESGARVSFRQIHKPSGKRVRHEKVVPGIGPVDREEIVKGFEFEKDRYVLLEPEELDALKLESKKTFELVQFVGACEILPLYFDRPYYLVPSDDLAEDAYRVIRDALRETERVGLGQITLRGREYLSAVRPCGDGLLLETLHYADEIREAAPLFADIEDDQAPEELLELATTLIEQKTAPFDAAAFTDHYTEAVRALVEEKRKSKSAPKVTADDSETAEAVRSTDNVVDLMEALQNSLKKTRKKTRSSSKKRKRA